MLSSTVAAWFLFGAAVALFNGWLSGLTSQSVPRLVFSCVVSALFAAGFGWFFMTSVNYSALKDRASPSGGFREEFGLTGLF